MNWKYLSLVIALTYNGYIYCGYKITHIPKKVKIKVGDNLKFVTIIGTDLQKTMYINKTNKVYHNRKKVVFDCSLLSDSLSNFKSYRLLASFKSSTGLITFDDKKFRGDIHITISSKNKRCDVIAELSMVDYISSLLSKEVNANWPLEVLKAQAIAARSYAVHKIVSRQVDKKAGYKTFYHLENSEKHQVNGHFFEITPYTYKAAKLTENQLLLNKKGELPPIFFHAQCGGRTLVPSSVWENKVYGYKSINDNYCIKLKKSKAFNWNNNISLNRFKNFIKWAIGGIDISKLQKVVFTPDRLFNTAFTIYIDDKPYRIKKALVRRFFGRVLVPSNRFILKYKNSVINLIGRGKGHGVGMCQIGALSMSLNGFNYKKILKYYYPNYIIKNINNR